MLRLARGHPPWIALVCVAAGGCLFGGDDAGSEGPPHTCDGATLVARFDTGVDPTGFVAEVEAAITDVAIDCSQHESAGAFRIMSSAGPIINSAIPPSAAP